MTRFLTNATLFAVAAALAVGLAGCPKKGEAGKDNNPTGSGATGPVAKVNGQDIPRGDFEKQMERTRSRFQRAGRQIAPALESRLKENLIRKMVEEELIAQKAKAEGVTLEAPEIDAKLAEHKARFGSDKAFQSFLERTQQSEADVKSDLEKNLLRDKLFAKLLSGQEPTDDDAKKYYEENKDKYKQKEQINAQHILFKIDKTTSDADKKKKLAEAKKVFADAKKPGADFGEFAKKFSEGPTAQRGGDLGTFSRGRMVKQFEDVAFAGKPGDILGPVETQFGYHIIKINEKTAEVQRPYDEVKDSILTSLKARQKSKATRDLLDKLKTDAKVEILEPGITLDPKKSPTAVDGQPLVPTQANMDALRDQAAKVNEGTPPAPPDEKDEPNAPSGPAPTTK